MERKRYIDSFDKKLKAWDKDIAKLEKKAAKITQTLQERIATVVRHRDAAASKTTDLLQSSEEAWVEVKQGAEGALNDMKKAFKKAKGKLGK